MMAPLLIAGGVGLVMVLCMTRAVRLWWIRQIEKVIDKLWK